MSKAGRRQLAAFAKLDALYAQLPQLRCRGLCSIACGPIPLTDLEARRLQLATHVAPRTTSDHRCVYLDARGRCTAYDVRPLICRAWGVSRLMSCMHGCVPERWLHDERFLEIAQQIERIAGGRVLRTSPAGLTHQQGETWSTLGQGHERRSAEASERIAQRTHGLRVLHGGHIIIAVDEKDDE